MKIFENLFNRPSNSRKSNSSKSVLLNRVKVLAKDDGVDCLLQEEEGEENLPYIEPINSFSPTASSSSVTSQHTIDTLREDYSKQFGSGGGAGGDSLSSLLLAFSPSVSTNNRNYQSEDYYFSMDDVDNLMLDPDVLEQYNTYKLYSNEEKNERREDRQLRRALIQEELDVLIKNCEDNDELQGHEFEDEAIEALGIAANKLAYLRKFYDVARCEYIYAPSIAYTIMDGSLLEEANKHYFGKSDEFLVMYAGAMGSSILTQREGNRQYMDLNRDENPLAEDLDLGSESDDDDDCEIEFDKAQVMKMVWGVSPQSGVVGGSHFTFDMKKKAVQQNFFKRKIGFKAMSFFLVLALLSVDWEAFMSLPTVVNLTNGDFDTVVLEGRKSVNTFVTDVKDHISTSKDNIVTFLEEHEELKKMIPVKFIGTNENKNNDATTRNGRKEKKSSQKKKQRQPSLRTRAKRPIVPNLLY